MAHARIVIGSLAFVLACLGCARAASDPGPSAPFVRDHIGAKLDDCLRNPRTETTIDISNCYGAAQRAYAVALDGAYAHALAHLDATSASRLRASQKSWDAYRKDATFAERGPWSADRGTIVGSEISQADLGALKQRIIEIFLLWPGLVGEEPLEIGAPVARD